MDERSVQVHGLTVRYKIAGKGLPLLLLHGWGGSADSFDKLMEQLPLDHIQAIAPDFPGFGKTKPAPRAWNVNAYRQFIAAFLHTLKIDSCALFGHSFGGRVGIKYAVHDPKAIKALILCSSAGIKEKRTLKQSLLFGLAKIGKVIFSLPVISRFQTFFKRLIYGLAGTSDYNKTSGVMRENFQKVIAEDLRPLFKDIKVPTLIIWGKLDTITPLSDGLVMVSEIANAEIKIINDAKHGVHKTHAKEVGELVAGFCLNT